MFIYPFNTHICSSYVMHYVTTPAPVDHTMPLIKYLQPISNSGSSREDSSMASEAHSVVSLAIVCFLGHVMSFL